MGGERGESAHTISCSSTMHDMTCTHASDFSVFATLTLSSPAYSELSLVLDDRLLTSLISSIVSSCL